MKPFQVRELLKFFHESTWAAIGLEMEGAYYQKAIQSASRIRKSINPDVKVNEPIESKEDSTKKKIDFLKSFKEAQKRNEEIERLRQEKSVMYDTIPRDQQTHAFMMNPENFQFGDGINFIGKKAALEAAGLKSPLLLIFTDSKSILY